ncbi:LysR substrate-binding domain-containing protein [Acidiphilium sp.]|uniref:LysR substrate-binding domain-containing protein n=1 Tax=Acidiphilium sp. TaxID=527 RepID=UPI00258CD4F6|nr:LysR substrate-binding domain-containing protein [Acidiphilium sp.]
MNIHPDLLRAFVTVVECGGLSRAAGRLGRGQSAISLQMKRLEDQLGVKLLERTPRHLSLTSEGELLLDHARRLLRLNDDLIARFTERELSGVVRLGAPEDFATSLLASVLAKFARAHPRVALEVTCELTRDVFERFRAGGLDIALVKREPSEAIGGIRVWREPLVWAAANRQIAETEGPLPLIVSPRPCVYRKRATDSLDAIGRPWRIAYTCGSLAGAHAAVRAGLGVTVLPKEMVPIDLIVLNDEALGLPDLKDTEMALIEAPDLSPAAVRLRDTIVRELEH